MDADQVPKYLNSPETPIYSKGRTLYGLNLTKAAIRKLGYAVLVEGYFDFAQVFQTQAAPVVASCGTALTPQQAQLLRRFTDEGRPELRPGRRRARAPPPGRASCWSPKGSTSTSWCWTRAKIPIRLFGGTARTGIVKDCAVRGRIWNTCWIRRRRVSISDTTNSRRQFLGKMLTVAARSRTRRPATSLPTGSPTRPGLQKRSSGPKSARRPSAGRP